MILAWASPFNDSVWASQTPHAKPFLFNVRLRLRRWPNMSHSLKQETVQIDIQKEEMFFNLQLKLRK